MGQRTWAMDFEKAIIIFFMSTHDLQPIVIFKDMVSKPDFCSFFNLIRLITLLRVTSSGWWLGFFSLGDNLRAINFATFFSHFLTFLVPLHPSDRKD
jgi:hypothetical protein